MRKEPRGLPDRLIRWLSASVVLATTACVHSAITPAPNDLIRFTPPPAGVELVYTTGLLAGRLQHRDGCFRVVPRHGDGPAQVVIWPHDYVAVERGGRRGVMDAKGRTVFDGERVRLGGGVVDALHAGILNRERAAACGGPYGSAYISY
ncbi:MAG: hypothetical protein ABW163_01065 [Luteimonas sp.]